MIVSAITILWIRNNGYNYFISAYKAGDYAKAEKIQKSDFYTEQSIEEINAFIQTELNILYEDFRAGNTTYHEAQTKLETIMKFTDDSATKTKIEGLHASQQAFSTAEKYEADGDNYNAMLEYSKVSLDDKNYNIAQQKIENNKEILWVILNS